ncbi:hypothetical protein BU17DRAFT_94172 [Hysterangium stoloniferum]|nr:hypothetical protein BU17DRAFT_94172 [Hysterangium stoloniferum]
MAHLLWHAAPGYEFLTMSPTFPLMASLPGPDLFDYYLKQCFLSISTHSTFKISSSLPQCKVVLLSIGSFHLPVQLVSFFNTSFLAAMVISCHLFDAPLDFNFHETAKSYMALSASTLVHDVKKAFQETISCGNADSDAVYDILKRNVPALTTSSQH